MHNDIDFLRSKDFLPLCSLGILKSVMQRGEFKVNDNSIYFSGIEFLIFLFNL